MSKLTRPVLKAVIRHIQRLQEESAMAAHYDAGFDAGEWSGPAHQDLLDKRVDRILSRFTMREVAELSQAEAQLMHIGHDRYSRYTDEFDRVVAVQP